MRLNSIYKKPKKFMKVIRDDFLRKLYGGHKPSLFIVGAQKCGTSSLHAYLNEVPNLIGSIPKEVGYFDKEYNFVKGNEWYESHFISMNSSSDNVFYESTPEYLYRSYVAQRIYDYNPMSKIIVTIREPVSRAYSAWNMFRDWDARGVVPPSLRRSPYNDEENILYTILLKNGCPSFGEYINYELELINGGDALDEPGIIRRGLYLQQIKRYVNLFGRDNVLILGMGDLKESSESVINKIHKFVFDSDLVDFTSFKDDKIRNMRKYPSKISPEEKHILEEFYKPFNQEFFEYLGHTVNW